MFKRSKIYLITWRDGSGMSHRDLIKAKDMGRAWQKIVKQQWPLTTSLVEMTVCEDEKKVERR